MNRHFVLVIDPGHGGDNIGTQDKDLIEKNYTLNTARMLRTALKDLPITIGLTRDDDITLTQQERGAISSAAHADLVISLHVNASSGAQHGTELYVSRDSWLIREDVAIIFERVLRADTRRRVRVRGVTDVTWMSNARAIINAHTAPVALIEMGYRTDERDKEWLLSMLGRAEIITSTRALVIAAWRAWEQEKKDASKRPKIVPNT